MISVLTAIQMLVYKANPLKYLFSLYFASRSLEYSFSTITLLAKYRLSCGRGQGAQFGDEGSWQFLFRTSFEFRCFSLHLLSLKFKFCAVDKLSLGRVWFPFPLFSLFFLKLLKVEAMNKINIGLFLSKRARFYSFSMLLQKDQNLLFQRSSSHIIMIAADQLQILGSLSSIIQSFCMVDIDERIFLAAHIENRTFHLLDHIYRLQLPQVKVSKLFFPKRALDVLLDRVDYALEQERGEKRQIIITQLVYKQLQIAEGVVRYYSANASIFG